uniref:ZP domain-containing protein n=1 Tax=Timema shepardi TaxID=629360 RepID=A0A7R9AS53_TIMSH|nr:unnamed protein product [Timema shepardi]
MNSSIHQESRDGLGFRVTDCVAHDGVGDSSQRLLDEVGCPLDELILPSLITTTETTDSEGSDVTGRASGSSHSRVQVAEAVFSAFKFPDRDSLHLRCTLQLCRGDCSEVECGREISNSSDVRRTARLKQGETDEVLERLEVFNSVEVLAPGIELDEMRDMGTTRETDFSAPVFASTGERAFCMSAPKMALAFGVLGLIFLCAVAVALCTLMRGRTNHYRRKLAMFGSEDTLVVQDSPFLGHRLQWPYVRVMR